MRVAPIFEVIHYTSVEVPYTRIKFHSIRLFFFVNYSVTYSHYRIHLNYVLHHRYRWQSLAR